MTSRIARHTAVTGSLVLLVMALAACTASAQWGPQQDKSLSLAASYAYSGGDNGWRLELARQDFVVNAGFFDAGSYKQMGNGDVYALELGVGPGAFMSDYEGTPFVVG